MCSDNWRRTAWMHRLVLASACGLLLTTAAVVGQEAKSPDPKPAAPPPAAVRAQAKPPVSPASRPEDQLAKVYSLRYVDGQTVLMSMRQVAPEAQATIDSRANRLIVIGSQESHDRVAEVIKTLDVAPREQEDRVVNVYSLRYMDPSTAASVIENEVPEASIGIDAPSRRLIVSASRPDHERVRELVEALDEPPDGDQDASQVTIVYQLRHIEPASAIGVLQGALPESTDVRMTAYESNNAIVVVGPSEVQERVGALLEKLDTSAERLPGLQLKVFSLVNADATTIAETILELFDGDDAKISVDPRTNSIVATGSEGTLEVIEALILRLDTDKKGETPSTTLQVRVVWLVGGLEGEEAAQPADDLKEVLDELAKLGVTGLRQAAQVLVNTAPSGDFQVSCAPRLDEGPTDMQIHGTLELKQGMPVLDIEITGTLLQNVPVRRSLGERHPEQINRVQRGELASLATKIAAPFGQYVVLGVTPAADLTSVFVVQVTPK